MAQHKVTREFRREKVRPMVLDFDADPCTVPSLRDSQTVVGDSRQPSNSRHKSVEVAILSCPVLPPARLLTDTTRAAAENSFLTVKKNTGAKIVTYLQRFTAALKSCPDTNQSQKRFFSTACKVMLFQIEFKE
jgi:hypothetical protein